MKLTLSSSLLALATTLAACSDAAAPRVQHLALVALSPQQTYVVGDTVDLLATVTDDDLNRIAGVAVTFTTEHGELLASSVVTNTQGRAVTRWVLGGELDTQRARAAISTTQVHELSVRTVAGAVARVVAGAGLEFGGLDMQQEIEAEAWDRFGNAIPPAHVSWIVRDPNVARIARGSSSLVQSYGNGTTWAVAQQNGDALDSVRIVVQQVAGYLELTGGSRRWILVPAESLHVQVRETRDINHHLMPSGPTSFTSDDAAVAIVEADGMIMGVGPGVTLVRATQGAASAEMEVLVAQADETQALPAEQVSLGWYRPCVVQDSGRALCWGILNGTAAVVPGTPGMPREIAGGGLWRQIQSGYASVCGIQTAGQTVCFGQAAHTVDAQLASVTGGFAGLCGVDAGTAAYCWEIPGTLVSQSIVPLQLPPELAFTQLAGSRYHGRYTAEFVYCGLAVDARAWCWGYNNRGQLGRITGDEMTPGQVDGNLRFRTIAPGPQHTCGITENFEAYCWGSNFRLQLGMSADTLISIPSPQRVATDQQFANIQTGFDHTCATSLSGVLYCWGSNFLGELGDGTTTQRFEPRPVAGNHRFRTDAGALSLGVSQTCAITQAGRLLCWGDNGGGVLGLGSQYVRDLAAVRRPAAVLNVP